LSINFVSAQVNNKISNSDVQDNKSYNWVVEYPDNTHLPFTASEIKKLEYVYGKDLQKHILNRPSRVLDIKDIFRNRFFIQKEDVKDISNYPLLSTVLVFDIFNKGMEIPMFTLDNFNPLVYNFNFNSKSRLIYRVDNTQFLIIIKSKFN
jgi:hypothetical protein